MRALLLPILLVLAILPLHAGTPSAWPGESYTGPLAAVTGTLTPSATQFLSYGAYPTGGSSWRYRTDFTSVTLAQFITAYGSAWRIGSFDDSAWAQGASQIGYGDTPRDEVTLVTRVDYDTSTTGTQSGPVGLFRTKFTIVDLAAVGSVTGRVLFDDSCAVYVNGTQVYRHGDLTASAPLTEYTVVSTTLSRENAEANFMVPLALLRPGQNTIAVEVHQHDPASVDISFDLQLTAVPPGTALVQWTAAGGPYRLTGDVTVPAGTTLIIGPGTRVFSDPGRRLIVNGIIKVEGTAAQPVMFSHVPGAASADDPREPGTQALPPKWSGILVQDSMSVENVISHATFYGAQPSSVEGCITVVRAACLVDHCVFCATYLHGVYGKNCSLTVQDSIFPDVFPPGKEALGEVLDNLSEFIEVDSPAADVAGDPAFVNGFPVGGVLRLYRNHFYGSSGHNDLVDITAGKWGQTPVLDVQDNHFHGPTGDEHIDLNGDAYIAGNTFENCRKDQYTSDQGYANGISSDVGGTDTTIVVVRNVFTHCDHAVNVKRGSSVIFEHNTVTDVNADYPFVRGAFSQSVKCSAVNFFIPEDTGRSGDGAWLAWNICYGGAGGAGLPRVLSWADRDLAGQPQKVTKLELLRNIVDPGVQDTVIGSQHPNAILSAMWQTQALDPLFTNRATRDYTLTAASPARSAGPFGQPAGHTIPAGCYLGNTPPAATAATSAAITIGGPGIFSYRWRLDGSAWSAPLAIATGVFPRTGATVRTAVLSFSGLAEGMHTLNVNGQDFAGNWQAIPTTATWLVSATPPGTYPLWLTWHGIAEGSDGDSDGLDALAEFAMGTQPVVPDPSPTASAPAAFGITFRLPVNAALTQGHGAGGIVSTLESSPDQTPDSWSIAATKAPLSTWTGGATVGTPAGGTVPITIALPTGARRMFFRLQFSLLPS